MSKEMREQINKLKNFNQFLNENFEEKKWIPFNNTILLKHHLDDIERYSIITKTEPHEIFIKNDKVLVSFTPQIYSLSKKQFMEISEIDFLEYDMNDYGVSILTFSKF